MKVADYIAEALAALGCTTVFGYQGSSIANLIDSIGRHPQLQFVESRNEQGAAFAANGYALAKDALGVAVACSGPGALNLVTGIANAYYDSVPCLFLTGQVSQNEMKPDSTLRQYGFQETDIVSIVESITKYAVSIADPCTISAEFPKAVGIALEGRPGPVLIDLPHNVQKADVGCETFAMPVCVEESNDGVSGDVQRRIREKLCHAKRPLALIGGGCSAVPKEVVERLSAAGIPVVASYRGKGHFDNHAAVYCGTIGVFGDKAANWALKFSDLLLCFGSRLDGRQTAYESLQMQDVQDVVVFDIDDAEMAKHPEGYLCVKSDAKAALAAVCDSLDGTSFSGSWLEAIQRWRERFSSEDAYRIADGTNPNVFLANLCRLCDVDANFVLDVGQNQLWSNVALSVGAAQHLIQSAGLGSMGFSLPAAIGAYCANGHQTICITGDGGLQMNIQELQLLVEYKIPLKIFVMNNRCLGLIRDYQHKALGNRFYGSIEGFGSPDYALLAKAYDLGYCESSDLSNRQLADILADGRAWLIEVPISQESTACPEPTYGESIINQSPPLSAEELERVRNEAYGKW